MVERPPRVLVFVIVVEEEDIREVALAAWGFDWLEGVDEGLLEALAVFFVGRADDRGKIRLGFCEEISCVFGGGHCANDKEVGAQGLAR